MNPVRKFFYTADSYLRHVTEPVGNAIADMFYVEAQQGGSGGRVGMLKRRDRQMRLFLTQFEQMVGDPNDPEIQRAIGLASGDQSLAAGDVMNAKAVAVREFLQKFTMNTYCLLKKGTQPLLMQGYNSKRITSL